MKSARVGWNKLNRLLIAIFLQFNPADFFAIADNFGLLRIRSWHVQGFEKGHAGLAKGLGMWKITSGNIHHHKRLWKIPPGLDH